MTIELSLLISIVSVSAAVITCVKGNKRSDTRDIEARVAENTKLNMKLDEIARSVNELKDEIRLQKQEVQGLAERMAKVEASAKQAHLRIDRMDGQEHRHEE